MEIVKVPSGLRVVPKVGDVFQIVDEHFKVVGGAYGEEIARKFAASPDLFTACKAMLGIDNPPAGEVGHVDFNAAVEMAHAAIAKAEGNGR